MSGTRLGKLWDFYHKGEAQNSSGGSRRPRRAGCRAADNREPALLKHQVETDNTQQFFGGIKHKPMQRSRTIEEEEAMSTLHSPTGFHGLHEDSLKSLWTPQRLLVDSMRTPQRLHEESLRTP
jgi:hypothetical protein